MKIQVTCDEALAAELDELDPPALLESALVRFESRIAAIQLSVIDANGPKGGVDKECRCVLKLQGLPTLVISDRDENLGALLHRVADRAAHAVSRQVDRKLKPAATRTRKGRGELDQ